MRQPWGTRSCAPFALTNPDGPSSSKTPLGTGRYLAVVDEPFMRIRPLDLVPGDTPLAAGLTALPGANDPANGPYIPQIALGTSSPDAFGQILEEVGLGQVNGNDDLVPGAEQLDTYADGLAPAAYGFASRGPPVGSDEAGRVSHRRHGAQPRPCEVRR